MNVFMISGPKSKKHPEIMQKSESDLYKHPENPIIPHHPITHHPMAEVRHLGCSGFGALSARPPLVQGAGADATTEKMMVYNFVQPQLSDIHLLFRVLQSF